MTELKTDLRESVNWAEAEARRLSAINGFGDVFVNGLHVVPYSDDEIASHYKPGDVPNWAGWYVLKSVDSIYGITMFIAFERHNEASQIVDTICHEIGHAVWELLDNDQHTDWLQKATIPSNCDPLEAFADEYMHFVQGRYDLMLLDAEFFKKVTAKS